MDSIKVLEGFLKFFNNIRVYSSLAAVFLILSIDVAVFQVLWFIFTSVSVVPVYEISLRVLNHSFQAFRFSFNGRFVYECYESVLS